MDELTLADAIETVVADWINSNGGGVVDYAQIIHDTRDHLDHDEIDSWVADDEIHPEVADCYRAVLDADPDDIDAELASD